MQTSMFVAFHYLQVLVSIICFDSIQMVNHFAFTERSPKALFYKIAMLQNLSSRHADNNITIGGNVKPLPVKMAGRSRVMMTVNKMQRLAFDIAHRRIVTVAEQCWLTTAARTYAHKLLSSARIKTHGEPPSRYANPRLFAQRGEPSYLIIPFLLLLIWLEGEQLEAGNFEIIEQALKGRDLSRRATGG